MQDRSYIKWAPFNSLINDRLMLEDILKNRNKVSKPILSEDQLIDINNDLIDSYINHLNIIITIYKDNNIINIKGYINQINQYKKYIIINNKTIYFVQILKIDKL